MSMPQLAVNLVLLLPPDVRRYCEDVNATLRRRQPAIDFRKAVPHLSLFMGVIDRQDLLQAFHVLETLGRTHPPVTVDVVSLGHGPSTPTVGLNVRPSRPLRRLHHVAMERMAPLCRGSARRDCFAGREVTAATLEWVRDYRTQAAGDHFRPHITLGLGELDRSPPPFSFPARTLALYQLGNFCTCTTLLASATLRG